MMATNYGFTREELDAFALASHRKAAAATDSGAFEREIVIARWRRQGRQARRHDRDEGIRFDASLEGLAPLKTARRGRHDHRRQRQPDLRRRVGRADRVSEQALKRHGLTPLARIDNLTVTAGDPVIMLEEPIPATRRALERSGRKLDDIDLYEVNEAFAPVPLAWLKEIGADPERLNVNGGAIALGHPLGATGTKLMATLVHALRARGKRYRPADDVRRRRHRQRDDRRGAVTSQ